LDAERKTFNAALFVICHGAIHLSPRRLDAGKTQPVLMASSYSSASSIRFSSCLKTPFFDYENEHDDDDDDEKQSLISTFIGGQLPPCENEFMQR
jgi:hypothetical protein